MEVLSTQIVDDEFQMIHIASGDVELGPVDENRNSKNSKMLEKNCMEYRSGSIRREYIDHVDVSMTTRPNPKTIFIDIGQTEKGCRFMCKTSLNLVLKFVSIIVSVAGMASDVQLACIYFHRGFTVLGIITCLLFVGPGIIIAFFSFTWYFKDFVKDETVPSETSKGVWAVRFVSSVLFLGRIWRTLECIVTEIQIIKSENDCNKEKKLKKLTSQHVDLDFLFVFESFLKSAPQSVFQLYVMLSVWNPDHGEDSGTAIWQWTKCGIGLLAMSLSLAILQSDLRKAIPGKQRLEIGQFLMYYTWRTFEIGTRITCICCLILVLRTWVFLPFTIHWFVAIICNVKFFTKSCHRRFYDVVFKCTLGYFMIFCYINMEDGRQRKPMSVFYAVFYVENVLMVVAVNVLRSPMWWSILIAVPSALHVIIMATYYQFCHPNRRKPPGKNPISSHCEKPTPANQH